MATRLSPATIARIEAAWPQILDALACGERLDDSITKPHGLSLDQVRTYRRTRPERVREWEDALEDSAHALVGKAQHEIEQPLRDQAAVGAARIRAEFYLKLAAKRLPRVYSEKAQIDVNVKHIDLTDAINKAQARIAAWRPVITVMTNSAAADLARAHAQDAELVEPERTLDDLR